MNENMNEVKGILYREEDINKLLEVLMKAKIDFENVELFCYIKQVLLNPIPFDKITV